MQSKSREPGKVRVRPVKLCAHCGESIHPDEVKHVHEKCVDHIVLCLKSRVTMALQVAELDLQHSEKFHTIQHTKLIGEKDALEKVLKMLGDYEKCL